MKIESSVFKAHESIPSVYTCDGENTHPPLQFIDIPKNTKTLVLLMDDPDAPKHLVPSGTFDHWVLYNLPPDTQEISAGEEPLSALQGLNGSGKPGYIGPCPPDGEHRYFFKLYALDTELTFDNPPAKNTVLEAMQGHILDSTELVGRYARQ